MPSNSYPARVYIINRNIRSASAKYLLCTADSMCLASLDLNISEATSIKATLLTLPINLNTTSCAIAEQHSAQPPDHRTINKPIYVSPNLPMKLNLNVYMKTGLRKQTNSTLTFDCYRQGIPVKVTTRKYPARITPRRLMLSGSSTVICWKQFQMQNVEGHKVVQRHSKGGMFCKDPSAADRSYKLTIAAGVVIRGIKGGRSCRGKRNIIE